MRTLYITDLDGTLLNSKGELSEYSHEVIEKLTNHGILFSVATARTAATVLDMFKGALHSPIALMNGVSVFDPEKNKSIFNHSIDKNTAKEILAIYSKHNKHPMLYFDKGNHLEIHYTEIDNIHQHEYITDRNTRKLKKFVQAKNYNLDAADDLLYIVSFDKYTQLQSVYKEISAIEGVASCFYADNYTDCFFLETMNGSISKGTAALDIKKITQADRIIAFGDNLNDIPLFRVADEAYAVSNAHEELKKAATGLIDSNDQDSVIKFILQHSEITL